MNHRLIQEVALLAAVFACGAAFGHAVAREFSWRHREAVPVLLICPQIGDWRNEVTYELEL